MVEEEGTCYRAFGDVVVLSADGEHPLRRRRERDTLGVLLAVRAPVSADRLLAEVWQGEGALGSLQAVVSRLRNVVEPRRAARGENRCLVSTSAGYAIRASVGDVDVWAFEDLALRGLATADPAEAVTLVERADALWTGTPYADCTPDAVEAARARLVDLRASAAERAAQALLDLGRPEQVGLLLAPRADEHPFRERIFALLAVAQYRCGRQSEALATLRDLRARLAEELGVDPTPEVRRLEDDLLHHSSSLDGPSPATPTPAPGAPTAAPTAVPERPRPSGNPEEMVGRDEPLTRVLDLLEQAGRGRRVVTVLGEPGIGKTRLVQEVLRRAGDRGVTGVVGQCHQGDVAPALWPWTQVVRTLAPLAETPDPVLGPLLEGAAVDTGSGTLMLFDAVARLLDAAAARCGGLVVVLEDLHWADATSLQLLTHLVDRPSTAPVLLVVTRRSTEEHRSEEMLTTLAALARAGAERVRLDGLTRAEVGLLLGRLLQTAGPSAPDRADRADRADPAEPADVPESLVAAVDEATAGNAFFVHEYARLLQTHGRPQDAGPLPVPDGIRDVILQRVDRLPERARELLRAAAVLDRDIEPLDAAALAGQPLEESLDHLDLALATGLLEEAGGGYAFAHALTRETLYGDLSAARRLRLHARAADVLAERLGDSPDAAADIAHHALLAVPLGPDRARTAFDRLGRAARTALARQAPVESRELWLRAREVAEGLGLEDERLHAMLGAARAAVRMGTFTEAPDLVKELALEAARLGHYDLVAAAAETFQQAGAWTWRNHGTKDEELIEVLTEALDHVDAADEAVLCATLTQEHQFGWDTATSDAFAERAIAAARAAEDPGLLAAALVIRIVATCGRADLGSRVPLVEELLAQQPSGAVAVTARYHLAYAQHEVGLVAEAEATMRRARAEAETLSHSGLLLPIAWWEVAVARDHDDPRAPALAAEALTRQQSQRFFVGTQMETLNAVLDRRPGTRLGDDVVARAREGIHVERALVAWALVEDGEPERAADVLGEGPPAHAVDYSVPAVWCLRLLVSASLGDLDQVREMLRRVDRYRVPLAAHGSVNHLGAFDHFRAVAHRVLGDPVRALELARSAVATNRRCDVRPWLRRSERLMLELEEELGGPRPDDTAGTGVQAASK